MPGYAYGLLAAGWLLWLAPFVLIKRNTQTPERVDRRARWGVMLELLAYSLLWQNRFWTRPPEGWRNLLSVFFFLFAGILSWTGARALGRQWRIDAGLNPDHKLVRSGPYRVVRHPIYTSMLCVLLGTGFVLTPLPVLIVSIVVFLLGTEIRVRIEDRLLASHFGDEFRKYQTTVPSYIPFLKHSRPTTAPGALEGP